MDDEIEVEGWKRRKEKWRRGDRKERRNKSGDGKIVQNRGGGSERTEGNKQKSGVETGRDKNAKR